MKLSDIYLGATDAKNELLNNSPEEKSRFKRLYVIPPNVNIERFLNHSKYFIIGLKGVGKTALLRYVSILLDEQENTTSKFILFKSEISERVKNHFSNTLGVEGGIECSTHLDRSDSEVYWRWFIYKIISDMTIKGSTDIFQKNKNLKKFNDLMKNEITQVNEISFFSKLIPRIRQGKIEISKNPKLNLDFDWDTDSFAKFDFQKLIKQADDAFMSLQPSNGRLNVFFDELDFNFATKKQHQRDSMLLRDLIVTIEKINSISKYSGFNICLFAAIRSEVLNTITPLGKDLIKKTSDFGLEFFWNHAAVNSNKQSLLQIVERRINNSREEFGLEKLNSVDLWNNYFPNLINNKKPQAYLVQNSWYRPRDIIRLLLTAQECHPDGKTFSTQSLEEARKRYSLACWIRMMDDLKEKYRAEEINGIKNILYGYKQTFTIQDFSLHAESIAQFYADTKNLIENKTTTEILSDLYQIGFIGNYSFENNSGKERFRYSFWGDSNILFSQKIYVHNALKDHLSID